MSNIIHLMYDGVHIPPAVNLAHTFNIAKEDKTNKYIITFTNVNNTSIVHWNFASALDRDRAYNQICKLHSKQIEVEHE